MSKFKKYFIGSIGFLVPLSSLAQTTWDASVSEDSVAYASMFAGNFSLLLSIVIGVIATSLVFRAARKMGGGLFGSILNYIGMGMTLVVIGTLSAFFGPWLGDLWLGIINTVSFAIGYIFMVIGANKLLKGIINT